MPAPAVSPNDLTRQQLDELDALLQRMLSLPVSKPATTAPPRMPDPPVPAMPVRTDPPAPPNVPHLAIPVAENNSGGLSAPAAIVPDVRSFTPPPPRTFDFPPPDRLFGATAQSVATVPPSAAEPFAPFAEPRVSVVEEFETVPLVSAVVSPGSGSRTMLLFRPLAAFNAVLEGGLRLFGPPGHALCSPFGKTVLGWGGLVLTAGAAAWVARGVGLVHFDWPR